MVSLIVWLENLKTWLVNYRRQQSIRTCAKLFQIFALPGHFRVSKEACNAPGVGSMHMWKWKWDRCTCESESGIDAHAAIYCSSCVRATSIIILATICLPYLLGSWHEVGDGRLFNLLERFLFKHKWVFLRLSVEWIMWFSSCVFPVLSLVEAKASVPPGRLSE